MANLQRSINTYAYDQAIRYYTALKKNFLLKANVSEVEFRNQFITSQKQSVSTLFSKVTKTNKILEDKFGAIIEQIAAEPFMAKGLSAIQDLENQSNLEEQAKKSQIQALQLELLNIIRQRLNSISDFETIMQAVLKQGSGIKNITHSTLTSLYTTYLSRLIMNYNTETRSYINNSAIAGYYQELAETDAWKKLGRQLKLQVSHVGEQASSITNKTTPIDITVGIKGTRNLQQTALDEFDRVLRSIKDMKIIGTTVEDFSDKIAQLNLKTVGIQSKLASLNTVRAKIKGYQIGSRLDLLKDFYNWVEQKQGALTQLESANYFGSSLQSILEALGPTNLIWITGKEKYFMDEFISTFRSQNMLLAFSINKERQLQAQVKLFDETLLLQEI